MRFRNDGGECDLDAGGGVPGRVVVVVVKAFRTSSAEQAQY